MTEGQAVDAAGSGGRSAPGQTTTHPVDIIQLLEDIRAEANKKRSSGALSAELEEQIEESFRRFVPEDRLRQGAQRLRAVVRQTERLSFISPHVSTASRKRYLEPVKKGIHSAVGWYMGAVVGQIQEFIRADLHALRVAAEVVASLEQRIGDLEAQVAELQSNLPRRSEAEPPTDDR